MRICCAAIIKGPGGWPFVLGIQILSARDSSESDGEYQVFQHASLYFLTFYDRYFNALNVQMKQGTQMCFSENVSYGAAALLITTGAVTTFGNTAREQRMIAAIPFLFGIQQVAEGIVWQTLEMGSFDWLRQFAGALFVSVVFVVWPSWLPWSLYQVEKNEKRKTILKAIGVMGLGVSVLAVSVLTGVDIKAYRIGHSLGYAFLNFKRSWPASFDFLLYDIPTMLPFFVSSLKTVKKAGYLVLGSLIVAQIINREATTSVWCFFAALISFYISVNILWRQRGRLT